MTLNARFAMYLGALDVAEETGVTSTWLEEKTGVTGSLIRRDLSTLADVGTRGVGYDVPTLRGLLAGIVDSNLDAIVAERDQAIEQCGLIARGTGWKT